LKDNLAYENSEIRNPKFEIPIMPKPEIARRCPSCGASIRDLALFCPQCGKQLPARDSSKTQPHDTSPVKEEPLKTTAPAGDQGVAPEKELGKDTQALSSKEPGKKTEQASSKVAAVKTPVSEATATPRGQTALGAMEAQIHRASTLARDVEGDVIHRVQKVREISNIVLDEAGYDPGLRFVLVAVFLFLLFLVIVLLNKLIA
jgi:predicted RNA-binding Zn-ribbon protein involved in translation (DUF1610 family)